MTTTLVKPHIVKWGRLWKCYGLRPNPQSYWQALMPIVRNGVTPKHAYDCWLSATKGLG